MLKYLSTTDVLWVDKEHQTIKEISPPFHEYRKEGKHATPHHNNTNDQCPSLVTNQLAKLEWGNQHLCLSRKRDLQWVMRVKELKHAKRSEQLFVQGHGDGWLWGDVPMAVYVEDPPGAVWCTIHTIAWHRTSARSIFAILITYWVLTMYYVTCWVIFKGFLA